MGTVVFRMDADEARAVQAFQRVVDKQRQVERAFGKSTAAANQTSMAGKKAGDEVQTMGQKMGTAATSMVAQFATATAAIGAVVAVMRQGRKEAEEAANIVRGVEDPWKRLVQISGGDAARLSKLTQTARTISEREGLDPAKAAGIVFQAESIGLGDHLGDMAPFARVGDLEKAITSTGKIRSIFGEKGGTPRGILSKLLTAAATSDVDVDTIAQQAIKAGPAFFSIGGTADELLAAMSVAAKGTSSPEEGATAIAALASVMRKGGMKSGFAAGLDALKGLPEDDPRMAAVKKEKRALTGFTALSEGHELFRQVFAATTAAGSGAAFDSAVVAADSNAQLRSILDANRAKARAANVQLFGESGTDELSYEQLRDLMISDSMEKGESPAMRLWRRMNLGAERFFGTLSREDMESRAGLYRPTPTDAEIEQEMFGPRYEAWVASGGSVGPGLPRQQTDAEIKAILAAEAAKRREEAQRADGQRERMIRALEASPPRDINAHR